MLFKNSAITFLFILAATQILISQTYQNAESVEYDPSQNRFIISNGNNMLSRASDGTLSFFGTGTTSHGLEVLGDNIYGLSGSTIKGFDLLSEDQVMTLSITDAIFLNGITSDGLSNLYVTDFNGKRIYKVDVSDPSNPTYEQLIFNTIKTPNGIIYDGDNNRLLFVTWGNAAEIIQIDLADNSMSTILTTNLGNIDGIDDDSNGNYYISSWSPNGRITKYDSNFENPITVTTPTLNSPADICYAQAIDTLGIPQGNDVDYVGFEVMTATDELENNKFELMVYPNPATEKSWIQFKLNQTTEIDLSIYDIEGRQIKTLISGLEVQGQHKVLMTDLEIPQGVYFAILTVNDPTSGQSTFHQMFELFKD